MSVEITELQKQLNSSFNLFKDSRKQAQTTRDYYEGEQLSSEIKSTLAERGQPVIWENNLKKFGKRVMGYKNKLQTEIKIYGKQKSDEDVANLLNDIVKSLHENSDFKTQKKLSDFSLMLDGIAIQEIRIIEDEDDKDRFGRTRKDIVVDNVRANEVFLDFYSQKADYSDAKYIHRAFYVDKEELYEYFDIDKVDNLSSINFTEELKLDEELYNDRERVMLCVSWYKKFDKKEKKTKWYYCYWSGNTILLQGESPYKFGHPYVIVKLNIEQSRGYKSLFYDILPLQDSINQAKIKIQGVLNSVKLLMEEGAVDDLELFLNQYEKINGVALVKDINKIKDVKLTNDITQNLQIIIDNRKEIQEILNLNSEIMGNAVNRMSGEAIRERVEHGSIGLEDFFNASSYLQELTIKEEIELIKEYYDSERILLIADEENMRYLHLNQPVENNGLVEFEYDDKYIKPKTLNNPLNFGKYDLTYKEIIKPFSNSTERYRQNVELMKMVATINPTLAIEILPYILKDSEAPSAKKILELVQDMKANEQNSEANSIQNQQVQLQMQEAMAKIQKIASEINLNNAKAQSENIKPQLESTKQQILHQNNENSNMLKQQEIFNQGLNNG